MPEQTPTPMLALGTPVALKGNIIARFNEHLEDSYRSYNVRLPDGQVVSTNVKNTLSLEASAKAEEAARQAETDAFQESLNALLEEKEAEHQAAQAEAEDLHKAHIETLHAAHEQKVAALEAEHNTVVEGLKTEVARLLETQARLETALAGLAKAEPTSEPPVSPRPKK